MKYNLEDYYYHTISKDDDNKTIDIFKQVLNDNELKSQGLLGKNESKYNGLNYISFAEFVNNPEYKTFIIDEKNYKSSNLSSLFDNYNKYLEYMKLDSFLETPMSKEEYFSKHKTNNKREYFKYLDSISRTYPVDIAFLYKKTKDKIYKDILELNNDDIAYCYENGNCFNDYIKNSKGITFVFPKTIPVEKVNIIPNLPFELENKLVTKISEQKTRYSNQLGEVQIKNSICIDEVIGIIVSDYININIVKNILKDHNININILKLINNKLIKI